MKCSAGRHEVNNGERGGEAHPPPTREAHSSPLSPTITSNTAYTFYTNLYITLLSHSTSHLTPFHHLNN